MAGYWTLGIDYGTTYTVAAVHQGDRTEALDLDGQQRFPSAVFLESETNIVVGMAAERRGAVSPERLERTPKRYLDIGQPPIALGPSLVNVTSLIAATLRVVWDEAIRQHGGQPPRMVVITHPAGWAARRRALLELAASEAGISGVHLMTEPGAAAVYLASERAGGTPVGHGEHVAVYDLGGGTFDAALLRRAGSGFELVGEPGGDPRIGGETFDDRLYRHLGQTGLEPAIWSELQGSEDAAWRRAAWEFRRGVREAKEAVSRDATSPVYLPPPIGRELLLTRATVEDLVRDDISTTIDILANTIDGSGVAIADLTAVYLVGGSSRMPIVGHLVRERFGRADTKGDPKQVVALGAARAAAMQIEVGEGRRPRLGEPQELTVAPSPGTKRRSMPVPAIAGGLLAVLAALTAVLILLTRSSHGTTTAPPAASVTTPAAATASPAVAATTPAQPSPTIAASSPDNGATTVSGTVTTAATGTPYPGASVEFTNIQGGWNIHTTTDGNGHYSVQLPPGFYNAVALDLNDTNAGFDVTNLSSNDIEVPGTSEVDFSEAPIT
jgi:Hsp70 protein/Carboxypeptidase regulatory-like domain